MDGPRQQATAVALTKQDKIGIIKSIFRGRLDAYGAGAGECVKKPLDDQVILRHLRGKQRIGVYPLSPDIMDGSGTFWACLDVDTEGLDFAIQVNARLAELGVEGYIERSSGRNHPDGLHLWLFFADAISAKDARGLMAYASEGCEVNPKQTTIKQKDSYGFGNYVNLPLFGSDVPNGRTVFLDPASNYQAYSDQWQFLKSIKPVTLEQIHDLKESGEIEPGVEVREYAHESHFEQALTQTVTEGGRSDALFSVLGHFKHEPSDVIWELAGMWNETKCEPPMDAGYFRKQVTSFLKQYHEPREPEDEPVKLIQLGNPIVSELETLELKLQDEREVGGFGLRTGFSRLDAATSGLQGLITIAGGPGSGKTTYVLQLVCQMLQQEPNARALVYELEMSRDSLVMRTLSRLSRVEYRSLRYGSPAEQGYRMAGLSKEDWEKYKAGRGIYNEFADRLYIYDYENCRDIGITAMRIHAAQALEKHPDARLIVCVDHLLRFPCAEYRSDLKLRLDHLIAEFRAITIQYDTVFLLITEQNRPGRGTGNLQSHMGTSETEYSADKCLLLSEQKAGGEDQYQYFDKMADVSPVKDIDVIIGKQRDEATGKIQYKFYPEIYKFTEA